MDPFCLKTAGGDTLNGTKKLGAGRYIPYVFIGPAALYMLIVTVIPALMAFPISLTDWTALNTTLNFVGLSNYKELLTDTAFHHSLLVMAEFFISIPLIMLVGLAIAMLLNNKIKGMTFFRVIYYSPVITSTIAAAVIFDWFFQPSFGLFNDILGIFGLKGIGWVYDASTAVMSITILKVWKESGVAMLIYLAGLQDVPQTLIEAAEIDGASPFQKFRHITFPLLKPAHVYLLVYYVINIFMIFQETYMFITTEVAPLDSATTVVNYIYEKAFTNSEMGYASAMSFVLFIVVFIVTLLQNKFLDADFN